MGAEVTAWLAECVDCRACYVGMTLSAGFDWAEVHEAEQEEHVCRVLPMTDPFDPSGRGDTSTSSG